MTRLRWKRKADPLVALSGKIVHVRDRETCQKCSRKGSDGWKVDSAHILSRGRAPKLKYEPFNQILLCARPCHEWADEHPVEFKAWVEEKWPGRVERLRIMERFHRKPDKTIVRLVLQADLARLMQETNATATVR